MLRLILQAGGVECSVGVLASVLSVTSYAIAGQIPEGIFGQTSTSAGGDCPTSEIQITKPTPYIIQITSNNGWFGYAYYTQQDDKYRGAFQWQSGKGGAYEKVVFLIDLVYEGQTVTLNAKSNPLNMSITYKKMAQQSAARDALKAAPARP